MSGIDLVTLASMLGHSRIQMVLRYAHPTRDHQTKAMERLEQFNVMQQIGDDLLGAGPLVDSRFRMAEENLPAAWRIAYAGNIEWTTDTYRGDAREVSVD